MNAIVGVDKFWAIGKNGQLLIRSEYDLAHFKEMTVGNVIIYGRKTLETFRDCKPLPNRTNIILTRDPNFAVEGAIIVHDLDELDVKLAEIQAEQPRVQIFVCGGASIYEQLLPRCKYAYVTHFDAAIEGADAFFPNLEELPNWHIDTNYEPLEVTYKNRKDDSPKMTMRFATWVNDDVD